MRCPDENVLAEYVDHVLAAGPRREVQTHLDSCVPCRTIVSDLARMQHASDDKTVTMAFAQDTGVPTLDIVRHRRRTAQIVNGTMIGEYEVTGVLGAGGMGIVFSAIHPRIGKKAAIKILKRELAVEASSIVRFENEARAVNAIGHPNIVDIFGFGELPNGDPYYVMEHVEGQSLHEWISAHGVVTLERAMPILRQICDALVAAHERGIIHRDLKPGNIMVSGPDEAPRVKVLDFGLAKMAREDRHYDDELTSPGVAIGTPAFMSPEQFMGSAVDLRTDVYALGVIIYQMLCGCYPFQGGTPSAIGQQHLYHTPAKPSKLAPLSEHLDQIVSKALAKQANERFESVRELRDELEMCARPGRREEEPRASPSSPTAAPDAMTMKPVALHEAPTVAIGRPVTPLPAPPPTRARVPRWLVVAAAFSIAAVAIAWIVLGRSDDEIVKPTPAAMPIETPAPPPPSKPTVEPIVEPVEPTAAPVVEETPTPVAKKPVKRAAKKPTPTPTPIKPAVEEDDDKMLLQGGTVRKQPK